MIFSRRNEKRDSNIYDTGHAMLGMINEYIFTRSRGVIVLLFVLHTSNYSDTIDGIHISASITE